MRSWLILVLGVLSLAGCRPAPLQQQESYVFGTRVEVLVQDEDPARGRDAIAEVLREFDRLHRTYHAWQPSRLTELNQAIAQGKPFAVDDELAGYIADAQSIARQSGGTFDPGIGRLIGLWGFQSDEFKPVLPDPQAINAWRKSHPSILDLTLVAHSVSSKNRQVALDFGGYLKGVALDRAVALLKAKGIHNALINIGGNVMALGSKQGTPWKVGIQNPRQPGAMATLALGDGEAIGTSGDYQRFFEVDGQRYCHLLDPRTGYPVQHTAAVTVLIPAGQESGMRSDALSKPLFVAGVGAWRASARALGVEHVLWVGRDGQIQATQAMVDRLVFTGQKPEIHVLP